MAAKPSYRLDTSLQNVLPPLDLYDKREGIGHDPSSKRLTLEQQIVVDGAIHDPLIVWKEKNTLVDGYERHAIAAKHKLPTKIVYRSFPDLMAAQSYRLRSQSTRRNIRPADIAFHLLGHKPLIASVKKAAQERMVKGLKVTGQKGDWMQILADMAGIGRSTIYQQHKVMSDETYSKMQSRGTITPFRAYKMLASQDRQKERTRQIIESGKTVPQFAVGDPLLNRILNTDVLLGMKAIPDESVHLVFTSPPYPLLSEKVAYPKPAYSYDGDYPAYLDWLMQVWKEAHRILVPGGRLIINTDNVNVPEPSPEQEASGRYDKDWKDAVRRNVHGDFCSRLSKGLFIHLDDIIWWKGAYVGTRPARGSFASASRPRMQRNWEDVTVYSKGGRDSKLAGQPGAYEITPEEADFWSGADYDLSKDRNGVGWDNDASVWRIQPNIKSRRIHPCAFPLELPWRLTLLYTFSGQTVVDPFSGIGTTLAAAHALGRNYIGIEAVGGYVVEAGKQIEAVFRDRVRLREQFSPRRKTPKRARLHAA